MTLRASQLKGDAVGVLSIHFREDAIDLGDDDKLLGRIPIKAVSPEGLESLRRENQLRMGTVSYQAFVAGVLSGVTLLFGPPTPMEVAVDLPTESGDQKPESATALPVDPVVPPATVATQPVDPVVIPATVATQAPPVDPVVPPATTATQAVPVAAAESAS